MAIFGAIISGLNGILDGYNTIQKSWNKVSGILATPAEISNLVKHIDLLARRLNKIIAHLTDENVQILLGEEDAEMLGQYVEFTNPLLKEVKDFVGEWQRRLPKQPPGSTVDLRAI